MKNHNYATGSKITPRGRFRTLVHIVIENSNVTLCGQELTDVKITDNPGIAECMHCKNQYKQVKKNEI